jgi:integrase
MRHGPSVRIATGIFRTARFFRATTSYRGQQVERHFPLTAGVREMREWQDGAKAGLRKRNAHRVSFVGPAGTLQADVGRYLAQTTAMASWKSQRSHLHAWTQTPLGSRDRRDILAEDVRAWVNRWLAAGVQPKTVRNRLVALAAVWRLLDPGEPTPVDGITVRVPKRLPAYVPVALIKAVDAMLAQRQREGRLHDAKTRARFQVIAATGLRPSQLRRLQPCDLDLKRRTLVVAGAKGGKPIAFYLNDDMHAALRLFADEAAWGPYDTYEYACTLRAAGWPKGIKPYALRHAVGQDLSEQGEDLQDIADWLGHTNTRMTRAYYVPVLNSRMRAMSERLDGRLGWGVPEQGPEKRGAGRRNMAKRGAIPHVAKAGQNRERDSKMRDSGP